MLTIGDFPAGWSTSKDESEDDDSADYQKQLAECLGASPDLLRGAEAAAHEDTRDFDSPDGNTTISESVTIDESERAEKVFEILHQSNLTDCMTDALGAYVKKTFAESDDADLKEIKVGDVEVGELSSGSYADDTVALRATVPIEYQGFSPNLYLDVIYVRHANAVANMTFEGVGTPVDPGTTAKFTRLAIKKLTKQDLPAG